VEPRETEDGLVISGAHVDDAAQDTDREIALPACGGDVGCEQ